MVDTSSHRPKAQNKQELYWRRRRAMDLKLAGATYDEIGKTLGISRQQAHQDVQIMMREYATQPATEVRDQEAARLDKLINTWWPAAIAGDMDATNTVLRIMDRRAKLLGLDAPQRINVEAYIRGMAMAEGLDPEQAVRDAAAIIAEADFG